MLTLNSAFLRACAVPMVAGIVGCAGINQQVQEEKARGYFESGGYTWGITADSEGGNIVKTVGAAPVQAATTVSNMLCKKYGRIAQYVSQTPLSIVLVKEFTFNCVR